MDTHLDTPVQVRSQHHARSVTIVSLLAALGLFFGYARDAGLAAVFGASSATDAFFVATIIPIMLGRVILSGALTPAVLPVFTGLLEKKREAWDVANTILTLSFFLFVLVTVVLVLAAQPIVNLVSPGLDQARASLAVELLVLSAPAVIFFGFSALLGALLNALDVYDVPALGTALVNGISLAAVLWVARVGGIQSIAASLVVGGLVQLAAQMLALRQAGWTYKFSTDWHHPAVREIGQLFVPLLAFMLVDQVMTITDRVIGSGFATGELSRLTYANKIFQVPYLLVVSSVVVVLFPALARHAQNDKEQYVESLTGGLRAVLLLTLPFALSFAFASATWIRLIFQRGEFAAADTLATADLLRWYSLAVIPTALFVLCTRSFNALRDTMTPFILSLITAGVYIAGAVFLSGRFQIAGLPMSFFAAQVLAAFLSVALLSLKLRAGLIKRLASEFVRVSALSLPLAVVLVIWNLLAEPHLANFSFAAQALLFGGLVVLGLLLNLVIAAWAGIPEARAYLSLILARLAPRQKDSRA
ncbi:MAG TPA: murein biosynthesis integral membrane protein MurJ [Anaerolineae bacterium]